MAELDEFRAQTRQWLEANAPEAIAGLVMTEANGNWGGRRATFEPPEMKTWLERMAERGWTAPTWPRE